MYLCIIYTYISNDRYTANNLFANDPSPSYGCLEDIALSDKTANCAFLCLTCRIFY